MCSDITFSSYNHNTMNSHDARQLLRSSNLCSGKKRTRRSAALLGVIAAAALCSSSVDAFSPLATPTSTGNRRSVSPTALTVSSTVDYQPTAGSSLVDVMREMTSVVRAKAPLLTEKDASKTTKKRGKAHSKTSSVASTPTQSYATTAPYLSEEEVMRRKLEWAGRYTSVEALRETFGTNQNKLWGDLQASTARRLYKTLLPRALVELSQLGVGQLQPQDLAPLAYQARVAAKLYARERCTVPARIGATLFDGFRQWVKYGKFQAHGMTYDQLWEKYAEKILDKTENPEQDICLKIIERSCVSNEGVDKLVLNNNKQNNNKAHNNLKHLEQQQQLLERIHSQLEQDMYQLLLPNVEVCSDNPTSANSALPTRKVCKRQRPWSKRNHVLIVRLLAKQKRILAHRQQQEAEQAEAAELRP